MSSRVTSYIQGVKFQATLGDKPGSKRRVTRQVKGKTVTVIFTRLEGGGIEVDAESNSDPRAN